MFKQFLAKIDRTAHVVKGRFPHFTEEGRWRTTLDGSWTGGYWIGLLLCAHTATNDEKYLKWAQEWATLLEPRKGDRIPDLGHLFYPSFVKNAQITRDKKSKTIALEAAEAMTLCFNENAGFLCEDIGVSGRKIGKTLVDFMVNLPLLWWAHKETGNKKYYDIAYAHSSRTLKKFIREDHSTIHVVRFDPQTGQILRKTTSQGYSDSSCWSRGQAWSIYGFVHTYAVTHGETFLQAAKKLADYFIKNLPNDHVPYWDFNDPKIPDAPKDSSAAAIACSGFISISQLSGEKRYKDAADQILNSLLKNYIAEENRDGILKHGCFHMPKKMGVDESLIWGDYYFLEALMKSGGLLQIV